MCVHCFHRFTVNYFRSGYSCQKPFLNLLSKNILIKEKSYISFSQIIIFEVLSQNQNYSTILQI